MLTDEERKRCIASTLSGTYYVGMAIVKHKINKIIKVDGRYIRFPQNKDEAMRWIRADLNRFPHAKASLQKAKMPFGSGWKAHSSYQFRLNRKTKKHRLVKL